MQFKYIKNLREMDRFLRQYIWSNFTSVENLNKPISIEETEKVITELTQKRNITSIWFHEWILSSLKSVNLSYRTGIWHRN